MYPSWLAVANTVPSGDRAPSLIRCGGTSKQTNQACLIKMVRQNLDFMSIELTAKMTQVCLLEVLVLMTIFMLYPTWVCPFTVIRPSLRSVSLTGQLLLLALKTSRSHTSVYVQSR